VVRALRAREHIVCLTFCRRDRELGEWLRRGLEGWRIEPDLVGRRTPAGPVPHALRPIRCNREPAPVPARACPGPDPGWAPLRRQEHAPLDNSAPAGDALPDEAVAALQRSRFLLVLCSPAAAESAFIDAQVRCFQGMGRAARVIPVVVRGESGSSVNECLPPSLRSPRAPRQRRGAAGECPIDLRPRRDGREGGKRRIVAALLGLPLDEVALRAERRRERRLGLRLAAAAALVALSFALDAGIERMRGELSRNEALHAASLARAGALTVAAAAAAPRLGLPQGLSLAALRQAEAGLEALAALGRDTARLRLRRADLRLELARSYAALGDAAAARARADEAGRDVARLAVEAPDNALWQRELSRRFAELGDLLRGQGRAAAAQASYRASVALAEALAAGDAAAETSRVPGAAQREAAPCRPGTHCEAEAGNIPLRRQWDLAARYLRLGDLDLAVGAHDEALAHYHESLAIAERLAAAEPRDARRQMLQAHLRIGAALHAKGELDEALAGYEAGRALAERLVRAGDAGGERALAAAHVGIGDVLALQDRGAAALASYRASEAVALRQVEAGAAGWDDALRTSHERIGLALEAQGDLRGALREHRAALVLAARLARAGGGGRELATAHGHVGDALRGLGDLDGALAAYREKRAIVARLAGAGDAGWQHELGTVHARIGMVHEARGDFAAAQREYETLFAIGRRFAAADPENPRWQRDLAVSHGKLAAVHHRRGKVRAALAELRRGRDIMAALVAAAPEFAPWAADLAGLEAQIAAVEGRGVVMRAGAGMCQAPCPADAAAALLAPDLDLRDRVAARPAGSTRAHR
jgi:tetratricopeptide (TPR) repeat protein